MASSGSITGSFNGSAGNVFTLAIDWYQTKDVANMRSSVRFRWYVKKNNGIFIKIDPYVSYQERKR